MSRKRRRRPNRPATKGRPPSSPPQPARRGLLDGLLAPRVAGPASMPGIGRSMGRGFLVVLSSPYLIGSTIGLPFLLWVVSVLAGFRGPAAPLGHVLAPPPISTLTFDSFVSNSVGSGTGVQAMLAVGLAVVLRATILAAFAGLIVDQLRGGAPSHWSIVRGLKALPATLAIAVAGFVSLNFGSILAAVSGGGLGPLAQIAILVVGVYLLAFAPIVALSERLGTMPTLAKAVRAARIPGAGNLTFAAIYSFVVIVLIYLPTPGRLLGVNPSVPAWVVILATSVLHVAVLAALAYRYLSVADEVPEPPPRREPARPGRR